MMSSRSSSACLLAIVVVLTLGLISGCGAGKPAQPVKAAKKAGKKAKSTPAKPQKADDEEVSLAGLMPKESSSVETQKPEISSTPPKSLAGSNKKPLEKRDSAEKPLPEDQSKITQTAEHPVPSQADVDTERSVNQFLWTRDGRQLVANALGTLFIIDVGRGKVISQKRIDGYQIALSPDETILAISKDDSSIEFWRFPELGSAPLGKTPPQKDLIRNMRFSSDGTTLYGCCYGTSSVQVWNPNDGKLVKEIPVGKLQIHFMELSADGNLLALGGETKEGEFNVTRQFWIWDIKAAKVRHNVPMMSMPTAMAFSANGKRLAIGGFIPSSIWVWDTESGKLVQEITGHGSEVKSLAFFDQDRQLASSSTDKTVRLWDPETGKSKAQIIGSLNGVNHIAVAPKVPWLASDDGGKIHFWSIDDVTNHPEKYKKTGGELRNWIAHEEGGLWQFDVSRDGRHLVSQGSDMVKFWDVETGKVIKSFPDKNPGAPPVAISPDGKQFAITKYGAVLLHSIPSAELQTKLEHEAIYMPRRVVYSPDGKKLVVAAGKSILVWDLTKKKLLKAWEADEKSVESIALTSDGKRLITGGESGKLTFWDLATYKSQQSIQVGKEQILEIALTSDDAVMATSSFDEPLRIWDVATSQVTSTMEFGGSRIDGLLFFPGTQILAVPAVVREHSLKDEYRNAITLMDVKTGKALQVLKGHTETVMTLRYLPGQKQLVTADRVSIKFWEIDPSMLSF